jgi:hypothetical protein
MTINPTIPLEIQRSLRRVEQTANTASERVEGIESRLPHYVSKSDEDLLEVAKFTRKEHQSTGRAPLALDQLPFAQSFPGLPVYVDNAAARAAGLAVGKPYRLSDGHLMVVY